MRGMMNANSSENVASVRPTLLKIDRQLLLHLPLESRTGVFNLES
jgi:hypothetical protein